MPGRPADLKSSSYRLPETIIGRLNFVRENFFSVLRVLFFCILVEDDLMNPFLLLSGLCSIDNRKIIKVKFEFN